MLSEHNDAPEHLPAGWLRSRLGFGQVDTALQPLVSTQVRRWSEILPEPVAGLTRLATRSVSQVPDQPSRAVSSQCRFSWSAGCHEKRRTLHAAINRRAVTEGGVAARGVEVEAKLSNKRINATRFAASRRLLAHAARRGSCARYAPRSADKK